jgi:16S rRNA (guanine966-N2)-methyltransferase
MGQQRGKENQHRRKAKLPPELSPAGAGLDSELRIIGGHFRGRKLRYHGDPIVRPMKHRVREAIFNLISTESAGRHAIDLFAGTGALGLEALSRGATSATFIERHVPSAKLVEDNIAQLGVADRVQLRITSAFLWGKRDLGSPSESPPTDLPWLVFCSPPSSFFVEREAEMLELIRAVAEQAPPTSTLVIESDQQFDFASLIEENQAMWDVRDYPPARVGIWRLAK